MNDKDRKKRRTSSAPPERSSESMKSELDARTIASLRAELLESACAAGSDKGESRLVKMFYQGKADAYESALSLINVALGGDPDEEEES